MDRIVVHSQVGSDGILQLSLPIGPKSAGQEVEVIVTPVNPPGCTSAEWQRRILETAGKWQGEFDRSPQGEHRLRRVR
jgi:hypothetical protein